MHTIHHTEAFVLKSIESGEANRRVWLFTKEFGLIVAVVQGVRKPHAKLRSHLIEYTHITADLVKGREVWRLVSASVITNPFIGEYDERSARTFIRALMLTERLCVEEGVDEVLFEHLEKTMLCIKDAHANPKLFDAVVLWKVLVHLGYLEVFESQTTLFDAPLGGIDDTEGTQASLLIKTVTDAIKRTHL